MGPFHSKFDCCVFQLNSSLLTRVKLLPLSQTVDSDMALKIYIKARATPEVITAFAERKEFDKILIYSKQVCPIP